MDTQKEKKENMWWKECGYDSFEEAIVGEYGDQSVQAKKYGFGVFKDTRLSEWIDNFLKKEKEK